MTHPPVWAAAAASTDDLIREVQASRPGYLESRLKPPRVAITEDGCWLWQGYRSEKAYGKMTLPRPWARTVRVHRMAFLVLRGPIPYGMTLDHVCRNRPCVNPAHLEPVPNRVNTLRGEGVTAEKARRTHCPRGHGLTGENVRAHNGRECLTCHEARKRRDAALVAAAAHRLGLTQKTYRRQYGGGGKAAAEVLGIPWGTL